MKTKKTSTIFSIFATITMLILAISNTSKLHAQKAGCVKVDSGLFNEYEGDNFDDDEIETIQTIDKDFISFTEGLAGNTSDKAIEVFYLTKETVRYEVWLNHSDGTATKTNTGTLDGATFDLPELSSIHGFNKENFRKLSICINDAQGWIDIEFYKDNNLIWSTPFFIRPANPSKEVAFVTNTYNFDAYHIGIGGRSYYTRGVQPGRYTRATNYPYNYNIREDAFQYGCAHYLNADRPFWKYFTENNVDFEIIDNKALTEYEYLKNYSTIVLGTHDEYWEVKTFKNIKKFLNDGGNLIILGGNTAYRVFKQKKNYKVITQHTTLGEEYEIVKDYLGAFFTDTGYNTYAPYIKMQDHKLMKGVPNTFGLTTTNICYDGDGNGASGGETDKKINDSFITLAQGNNPNGGGADLIYKEFSSGGKVINFSSLALVGSLEDPGIDKLLKNIITDFIHKNPLSVDDAQSQKIILYPNPATKTINIKGTSNYEAIIYTILGEKKITTKATHNGSIDISSLKKGLYFLQLNSNEKNSDKSFMFERN